jgi:hypothetical protein
MRAWFEDVFARYLPEGDADPAPAATPATVSNLAEFQPNGNALIPGGRCERFHDERWRFVGERPQRHIVQPALIVLPLISFGASGPVMPRLSVAVWRFFDTGKMEPQLWV